MLGGEVVRRTLRLAIYDEVDVALPIQRDILGSVGAFDYIVKGHMIGGFAAIAWPANYGVTGIQTFQVNNDGVVYQKDLGPSTAEVARKITRYDPGDGWVAASDK